MGPEGETNVEKVVLAYSGGLDTSVLVRILKEEYKLDVVAVHVDVGEARAREQLAEKAKKAGAIAFEFVEAQEEFVRDICWPTLQANALYEGVYPLSAALSRALIAKHLVAGREEARRDVRGARLDRQGERSGAVRPLDARPRAGAEDPRAAARAKHLARRGHRVRQEVEHRRPRHGQKTVVDRREPVGAQHRGRRARGSEHRAAGRVLRLDDAARRQPTWSPGSSGSPSSGAFPLASTARRSRRPSSSPS